MSTDPPTTADPEAEAETADPEAPIPYTLTPLAEAYLDGSQDEAREPEPEAGL
jgi:hypothetical protein